MNLSNPIVLACLVVTTGCASIQTRTVDQEDTVLSSDKETRRLNAPMAIVQQDGTKLSLSLHKACKVQWVQQVQRTTTTESYNASPEVDYLLALAGGAAAIGGAVALADAQNMYPNDESSRQYNPYTQGEARAGGGLLIGTGAVMMLIPIIDAARASGTETTVSEHTKPGDVVNEKVPCPDGAIADAEVKGRVNDKLVRMGETDADGKLEFDLVRIPVEVIGDAQQIELTVGSNVVGTASTDVIHAAHAASEEESAFEATKSCEKPEKASDCDQASEYLHKYPDGKHKAEVEMMLRGAQGKLRELKDEAAWSEATSTECEQRIGREACLLGYKRDFPQGQHAAEIDALLEQHEKEQRRKRAQESRQNCISGCAATCKGDAACIRGCRKAEGCP